MRRIAVLLVVGGTTLAFCSPAFAQGRGGRGGFFGGGVAMLLTNKSVQAELKLDEAQITKAQELAEKTREQMQEMRSKLEGLEQEELMTKMREMVRETNEKVLKAVGEFLKPEQVTRVKEISLQTQGAMAFSTPEVAKKLGLTDAQKSDIQAIVDDSREEMRSIFQENQDDPDARMKKMAELRKQTLAKAEAKLNDEQRRTWKEMIGAPFEIRYEPRPNN